MERLYLIKITVSGALHDGGGGGGGCGGGDGGGCGKTVRQSLFYMEENKNN